MYLKFIIKFYIIYVVIFMIKYIDKNGCYIGDNVKIGENTIIYPFVVIEGNTEIGSNCLIGPNSFIRNSRIGSNCNIYSSHIFDSNIGCDVNIGPYAFIRNEVNVSDGCKIGTFVEIKKSNIDFDSKVPHLSYIGDSDIGRNVNIGGGTITANYDGEKKNKTIVDDGAFIGVNCSLVAPVKIGSKSVVGASSCININVPSSSLAIARTRQINKNNYYKNNNKNDSN